MEQGEGPKYSVWGGEFMWRGKGAWAKRRVSEAQKGLRGRSAGPRGQSDGDWRAAGGHRAKVGLGQPEPVGGDCHLR